MSVYDARVNNFISEGSEYFVLALSSFTFHFTPGVNVFDDENAEQKRLVEAKYRSEARKMVLPKLESQNRKSGM